ncbi:MAG: cytochrome C, partial [Verrucomicrobia bacterium]
MNVRNWIRPLCLAAVAVLTTPLFAQVNPLESKDCVECHTEITPGIVKDWKASVHKSKDVGCGDCHGIRHKSKDDVDKVLTVTADTCATCHADQTRQFKKGKH